MKSIFLLVLIAIVIIPILSAIPILGTDVWYVHYLGLFSCFCIGLALVLWQFNYLYTLFAICCIHSALFTAQQYPRSTLTLIQILFGMLSIYAISKFTKSQRKKLIYSVLVIATIECLWIVLQYFNLDPVFNMVNNPLKDVTVGSIGSHNQVGVFFSVLSPIITAYFPLLLPFIIFGLWCSTTTTSWLGFVLANLFMLMCLKSKIVKVFLLIVLICSFIFFIKFEHLNNIVLSERLQLIKHTISQVNSEKAYLKNGDLYKIITCNRFFGYGIGNYIRISPYTQYPFLVDRKPAGFRVSHVYEHVHNDYAEAYFELGILGAILLGFIIIDLFYKFFTVIKTKELIVYFACILAQMINALGVYTVHTAVSGMLLILFLGLFYGAYNEQRKQITK